MRENTNHIKSNVGPVIHGYVPVDKVAACIDVSFCKVHFSTLLSYQYKKHSSRHLNYVFVKWISALSSQFYFYSMNCLKNKVL